MFQAEYTFEILTFIGIRKWLIKIVGRQLAGTVWISVNGLDYIIKILILGGHFQMAKL
jgi:hypothetical protein